MSNDKATKPESTMIEPIKLLAGSHADTAETGSGCFMNVIAYLNGEAQITDQSECVCYVMRPLAIYANDLFGDKDRQKLLPFILRAIGSRTDDKEVIMERLRHVVAFAEKQGQYAAEYAEYAEYAKYAAESAAEYAKYAKYAKYAAKYAESAAAAAEYAKYAKYAAEYAKSAKYAAKYAESAAAAAEYAKYTAEYAKYAKYAAKSAAEYAKSAKYAEYAEYAKYAAKYAESAAAAAAKYAEWYNATRDDLLALFDACFPQPTEPQAVHIGRAKRLHETAQKVICDE